MESKKLVLLSGDKAEKYLVVENIKRQGIFDVTTRDCGNEPDNYNVDALVVNGHKNFALIYFDDYGEAMKMCLHHIKSGRTVEWHHFELTTFDGWMEYSPSCVWRYKTHHCHTVKTYTKLKPLTWDRFGDYKKYALV